MAKKNKLAPVTIVPLLGPMPRMVLSPEQAQQLLGLTCPAPMSVRLDTVYDAIEQILTNMIDETALKENKCN